MIYLASPYTHDIREVEKARARAVAIAASFLTSLRFHVFAPIAYTEALRSHGNAHTIPGDWSYWQIFDRYMIERCSTFAVLTLGGWQMSVGIEQETRIAHKLRREIVLIDPHAVAAAVPDLTRLEASWKLEA